MYAIVDIETTGGSPKNSRITEIAILLHDGKQVVRTYSTLVNPQCPIPYYITQVTGITNEMVEDAPPFHAVARDIVEITQGAVFVAHNVNFDYSFIRESFRDLGYNFQRKTRCTVRESRKAFPGLPSYSLGRLCESLKIPLSNRHRALGDAEATAILFGRILEQEALTTTKGKKPLASEKIQLPPMLPEETFNRIPPQITGVYYFHGKAGEVLYVGKSKDIRKRIQQHFAARDTRKAIQMFELIADISFENTGSELLALLKESERIKSLRPLYNSAQKRHGNNPRFGMFEGMDPDGYRRLTLREVRPDELPLLSAENMQGLREEVYKLVEKHQLCLTLCDLYQLGGPCFDHQLHKCRGACIKAETPESYNARVAQAIAHLGLGSGSFFIKSEGRHDLEQSVVFIEAGRYRGFGYINLLSPPTNTEEILESIEKGSHNADTERILQAFLKKNPPRIPYAGTASGS